MRRRPDTCTRSSPERAREELGPIGLDGARVYVLWQGEIGALVHDCPPEPYQGDTETMMGCVNTHNDVIDRAWAEAGSILPMRFDVIVRPDEGHTADENVRRWLEEEHSNFKIKLDEFRDKVELGVQLLWDPAVIASNLAEGSEEIGSFEGSHGRHVQGHGLPPAPQDRRDDEAGDGEKGRSRLHGLLRGA